jgi:hypothetical protein
VRDDLMPVQVEIDPLLARPPLRTAQHATVEGARRAKVVDGKGEVKGAKCHGFRLHALEMNGNGLSYSARL